MSLKSIVKALKRLSGNDGSEGNDEAEHLDYYCAEDALLIDDLSVTVTGIGKLSFPLTSDVVENIVKVSSKAKFGKGEATLFDMTVRDTQMIPANMLNVGINDELLSNILQRIGAGLNIDKYSRLVPHLYNMLIYGPGQFFKSHRDSEKIKNMVATLVILLPSSHKGGDLIIRHKKSKHIFFGSQKHNIVKCIAFYSDCHHEIEKVTEGYRVALTYNVGLQSPGVTSNVVLDEGLNRAVQLYFLSANNPKRLVFYLNHSYSEHSLKWNLLKEIDRTFAFGLLAVAKEQGRVPCLALADYREEVEGYSPWTDGEVIDSETELVFWVDEFNLKFNESTAISKEELCYTTETTDLFEPYKVEEEEYTGNEGGYKENWYRRACVVLWSNKWDFEHGFKNTLHDLQQLTSKEGNEKLVLEEINKAGSKFFNMEFWHGAVVKNLLLDIAAYVKDKETAVEIFNKLSNKVVNPDKINYLLLLEANYGKEVLIDILKSWSNSAKGSLVIEKSLATIEKYFEGATEKDVPIFVVTLLLRAVKKFVGLSKESCDFNAFMDTEIKTMYRIVKICTNLENHIWETAINYILLYPSVYPLHLANVLLKIKNMIPQNEIHMHQHFTKSTLELVEKLIPQLEKEETNWSWPYNFPCKCPYCCKFLSFLHSSEKTIEILFSSEKKLHIKSVLQHLKDQPVKCTIIEKTKLIIAKKPELVITRKKLLVDLDVVMKKWTSTEQKTVHSECTEGNTEASSLIGSPDNKLSSGSRESANKRKKVK